ncbi:hypothetical protein [Streptomyces sp. NPDC000134]|uniref:hypothetical protein n=1 Tax=Streptomyces sp. NPDC000134 TaxID=3364536 RepID=UPI00368A4C76
MRLPRTVALASLPATLVLLLTGCDSAPPAKQTPAARAASSPAPDSGPPTGAAATSLWSLIDSGGKTIRTLPDDDPDVTAVRKAVALHSAVTDNRDFRSVTASVRNEFGFYTPAFAERLGAEDYASRSTAFFVTNKLATRQKNTAWYRSTVYRDRTTAKVEMDTVIEFTAGDPGYLKKGGFTTNVPYTQHRSVDLVKEKGRWMITGIEKSPLSKPAERPAGP